MALKHSDYQKLLKLSDYTCMVSGPAANAECTRIYTTVSAIDFAHYVDECNKLSSISTPTSSTVIDFDNLIRDINSDLTMVKGIINTAADKQAATPAIVVRGELSTLVSQVKSQREKAKRASKHPTLSNIQSKVEKTKKGINKVVGVYKKFSGPAEEVYNKAEKSLEDGGGDFYSSFMRRKK
jgi:hypothetical protein